MPASSDVRTHHCAVLTTVTMASTETVMDRDHHSYRDRDRDEMRGGYKQHHDHLTPGLGKCDHSPSGLERQLAVRGTRPRASDKRFTVVPTTWSAACRQRRPIASTC